ncbi:hypothetical protein SETIT_2G281400v2 [Setaria italica]|uniref:Secreted protein n=1 Tax=Setaria italica TaxID=4555 RepID=A0A368Q413_SETIT|nr:hypothetical protein SETIT_2G281400v2 [Setaria italica]
MTGMICMVLALLNRLLWMCCAYQQMNSDRSTEKASCGLVVVKREYIGHASFSCALCFSS